MSPIPMPIPSSIPVVSIRASVDNPLDSFQSILRQARPALLPPDAHVRFRPCTNGLTNTLFRFTVEQSPSPIPVGTSSSDATEVVPAKQVFLLRAYGRKTDLLIDRDQEANNHQLLMHYGLASELIARFENGLLYRFVAGTVASEDVVGSPEIRHAVARRLAEWHARVPYRPRGYVSSHALHNVSSPPHTEGHVSEKSSPSPPLDVDPLRKATPSPPVSENGLHPPSNPSPSSTSFTGLVTPLSGASTPPSRDAVDGPRDSPFDAGPGEGPLDAETFEQAVAKLLVGKPFPNLWTVLQKWLIGYPASTPEHVAEKAYFQREFFDLVKLLANRPGLGPHGLVFSHCDLLSGNIIIDDSTAPSDDGPATESDVVNTDSHDVVDDDSRVAADKSESPSEKASQVSKRAEVHFIDYEYATPAPAAFDIANHFSEWGGFACEYHRLPSRDERRDFLREYITAYYQYASETRSETNAETQADRVEAEVEAETQADRVEAKTEAETTETTSSVDLSAETETLLAEVDLFRGLPSFYWGVWAKIQHEISEIEFNYGDYATLRLREYEAWKEERAGTRPPDRDQHPREKRWAE